MRNWLIYKIKRLLNRCDDCWSKSTDHFWLPSYPGLDDPKERKEFEAESKEKVVDYHYCHEHARTSGFCYSCGYFMAGIDSFDFSPVKGMCLQCIDEFNSDIGIDEGEYYGEYDYYDGYDHSFEEKQPNQDMKLIDELKYYFLCVFALILEKMGFWEGDL